MLRRQIGWGLAAVSFLAAAGEAWAQAKPAACARPACPSVRAGCGVGGSGLYYGGGGNGSLYWGGGVTGGAAFGGYGKYYNCYGKYYNGYGNYGAGYYGGYGGGSSVVIVQSPTIVVQTPPAPGYVASPPPPGGDPAKLPPPALGPAPDPTIAYIDLNLPETAELWVQGMKMTQTGSKRRFVTPGLTLGYDYNYELRIAYKENDKEVSVVRHVSIRAGDRKSLTIIAQPAEIAAAK